MKERCRICGEPAQDLGGGFWITLCPRHHVEEIAKNPNVEPEEDDFYAESDFPCGY